MSIKTRKLLYLRDAIESMKGDLHLQALIRRQTCHAVLKTNQPHPNSRLHVFEVNIPLHQISYHVKDLVKAVINAHVSFAYSTSPRGLM